MLRGKDFIGVGVGALVFNADGKVFLAQRGRQATNERGTWEFPGGKVEFGATLIATIIREFLEEYGMEIEVIELLGVSDHILPTEQQHWVSPTFIARYIAGVPAIREPEKCLQIGWFALSDLPTPLSQITCDDLRIYQKKYGQRTSW